MYTLALKFGNLGMYVRVGGPMELLIAQTSKPTLVSVTKVTIT